MQTTPNKPSDPQKSPENLCNLQCTPSLFLSNFLIAAELVILSKAKNPRISSLSLLLLLDTSEQVLLSKK
jgi:hypothetical protein